MPELSKHADITGDTGPINNFITDLGAAIEQDTSRWTIPSREQEPDEQQQQMAQQDAELEMAKKQADLQKVSAEAEGQQIQNEAAIQELNAPPEVEGEVSMEDAAMLAAEEEIKLNSLRAQEELKIESMGLENALELQFQEDLNKLKMDAASVN